MRQLTAKQKKILDKFITDCKATPEQKLIYGSDFMNPWTYHPMDIVTADDLHDDIWAQLQRINDTEILYQEVDRYLQDKSLTKD